MIIGSLSIWKELKKYARQLICPFMHIFFTVSYWGQNLSPSVAKVFYRTKQLYSLKSKLEFFFWEWNEIQFVPDPDLDLFLANIEVSLSTYHPCSDSEKIHASFQADLKTISFLSSIIEVVSFTWIDFSTAKRRKYHWVS